MLGKLNDFQIDRVLLSQTVAHLGCYAAGKVYVVPFTYVYEDNYLYAFTIEGRKIEMMRENPEVCIEIDQIEDRAHWQSVILWGTFEEMRGGEAEQAILRLNIRLHPLRVSETLRPFHSMDKMYAPPYSSEKTVAFRIKIKEKTGRFERD